MAVDLQKKRLPPAELIGTVTFFGCNMGPNQTAYNALRDLWIDRMIEIKRVDLLTEVLVDGFGKIYASYTVEREVD